MEFPEISDIWERERKRESSCALKRKLLWFAHEYCITWDEVWQTKLLRATEGSTKWELVYQIMAFQCLGAQKKNRLSTKRLCVIVWFVKTPIQAPGVEIPLTCYRGILTISADLSRMRDTEEMCVSTYIILFLSTVFIICQYSGHFVPRCQNVSSSDLV